MLSRFFGTCHLKMFLWWYQIDRNATFFLLSEPYYEEALSSSGKQHLSSPRPFLYLGQYGGCFPVKQKDPLVPIGVCCPITTYSPALWAILGPEGHLLEQGSAKDS